MPRSSAATKLEILMKEYALLREEVLLHFKNSKLHTKYFQAFFAACLVISWYLFFLATPDRLTQVLATVHMTQGDLLVFLLFAMDVTSYYFAFDILDCYFCIFLALGRLATIEEQVNEETKSLLLIWESKFQLQPVVRFGISRFVISIYQMALVIIVSCAFPLYCYYRLWSSGSLSHNSWLCVAISFCVGLFILFVYTCYEIFIKRREEPIRVVRQILAGKI